MNKDHTKLKLKKENKWNQKTHIKAMALIGCLPHEHAYEVNAPNQHQNNGCQPQHVNYQCYKPCNYPKTLWIHCLIAETYRLLFHQSECFFLHLNWMPNSPSRISSLFVVCLCRPIWKYWQILWHEEELFRTTILFHLPICCE